MKIYATTTYHNLAEGLVNTLPNAELGTGRISRYPNGEMFAMVTDDVRNEECWVVGSIAPPDTQLVEVLMLTNALARSGAGSIKAFMPYLGYARQDKSLPRESGGIALIGSLLKSAGLSSIVTIDAHSILDRQMLGISLRSLSPAGLFAPVVKGLGWSKNFTVVAPDEGARQRAADLSYLVTGSRTITHLVKRRTDGIVHLRMEGTIRDKVILVDDIIDSGRTLVSACRLLQSAGAKDIRTMVTHGLFTGSLWRHVFRYGVKAVYVSDSYPEAIRQKDPRIHIVPLKSWLQVSSAQLRIKEKIYA